MPDVCFHFGKRLKGKGESLRQDPPDRRKNMRRTEKQWNYEEGVPATEMYEEEGGYTEKDPQSWKVTAAGTMRKAMGMNTAMIWGTTGAA